MPISLGCEIGRHEACDPRRFGCSCPHHKPVHPRLAPAPLPPGVPVYPMNRPVQEAMQRMLERRHPAIREPEERDALSDFLRRRAEG